MASGGQHAAASAAGCPQMPSRCCAILHAGAGRHTRLLSPQHHACADLQRLDADGAVHAKACTVAMLRILSLGACESRGWQPRGHIPGHISIKLIRRLPQHTSSQHTTQHTLPVIKWVAQFARQGRHRSACMVCVTAWNLCGRKLCGTVRWAGQGAMRAMLRRTSRSRRARTCQTPQTLPTSSRGWCRRRACA